VPLEIDQSKNTKKEKFPSSEKIIHVGQVSIPSVQVIKKLHPSKGMEFQKNGDDLLSHNNCSTIGAGGLNFSVRNGKRWNPAAIFVQF
jgi:hypothetical protein